MAQTLSKLERERRQIVLELSRMSRGGWANARHGDYEQLEKRLRTIESALELRARRLSMSAAVAAKLNARAAWLRQRKG